MNYSITIPITKTAEEIKRYDSAGSFNKALAYYSKKFPNKFVYSEKCVRFTN